MGTKKRLPQPIYQTYMGMEDAVSEMNRLGYPHFVVWIPELEAFSCRHTLDRPVYKREIIVAMHPKCGERLYFAYGLCPRNLVP